MTYRLYVNVDSTVMVRMWSNGVVEVATRDHRGGIWGPPTPLVEEQVYACPDPESSWIQDVLDGAA